MGLLNCGRVLLSDRDIAWNVALVSVTLNRKGYGMKSTSNTYDSYHVLSVGRPRHKQHTLDLEVSQEQDLNQAITRQYPFVQTAIGNNTALEKNHSLATWIKSTSWQTTYGNIQESGENAF